ncbi:MAG: TRAP transporter permease, partial [Candidatus Rokuibacteriota bacterium]
VYVVVTGVPEALILRGIHLMFAFGLIFLCYPRGARDRDRLPGLDVLLIALVLASIGWLFWNYEYVRTRIYYVDDPTLGDKVFGTLLVLLTLEAARRTIGWVMPATAVVFLAYAFAGPYLPGLLRHPGMPFDLVIDQLYLTTEGIWGIPVAVSATYVILFVVFGAFLERSGTGKFFMDFARGLTGGARGGPGKISVVSSSLFGTISGSAVANVMVDGWLTIPLMKRTGFRPPFAAAVEATASTGGQIMPPVMGAAAFVMAEFLQISYARVAMHALVPAVLYYVALFFSIHFEALRTGLRGIPRHELPSLPEVILRRGHLFLPVIMILVFMVFGFTPTFAAFWATLSVIALYWMRTEGRWNRYGIGATLFMGLAVALAIALGWSADRVGLAGYAAAGAVVLLGWMMPGSRAEAERFVGALQDGARNTLNVAAACACAGIVIGIIALTGLGIRFTSLVLALAGASLIPALVLTMLAGIVLGMGMPTTPAYIVQAALLIPALIKLGVLPVAAHMFVLYFACLSAITPPVALAVYAAAGIGGAPLWQSGWEAVRVGAAGFIVPYMFVYGTGLLLIGDPADIALAIPTAVAGSIFLAAGLMGYLFKPATWWERGLLLGAALLLIDPGLTTDLLGAACFGAAAVSQALRKRMPFGAAVEASRS